MLDWDHGKNKFEEVKIKLHAFLTSSLKQLERSDSPTGGFNTGDTNSVPFGLKLCGSQSRFERCGVKKTISASARNVSRVAQSVMCLATGWTAGRSRFEPRQRRKDYSSSLCVQTGSGAHSASGAIGTVGPFLGTKARQGRDADHSPPSSAEVRNE
jgi:hypothetical protein